MPFVPINRLPLLSSSPINSPSGIPSNLRNSFRLSCQKILTGGMEPLAGKSKRSTVCWGKQYLLGGAGQGPYTRGGDARRVDQSRRNLSAASRASVRGCGEPAGNGGGLVSLRSMTGFARVRRTLEQGERVATLKSVNHRGLDMHCRMPLEMDALENDVRGVVRGGVARGHVEIQVS